MNNITDKIVWMYVKGKIVKLLRSYEARNFSKRYDDGAYERKI